MKVIFLKDVAGVAQKFAVKEVAGGYAQHLIRTGCAEPATGDKLAKIENLKKAHALASKEKHANLEKAITEIAKEGVSIMAKANDKGHLFEGITAEKIREAIVDSIVEIPEGVIMLDEPIKEVGEYKVTIAHGAHKHAFTLVVAAAE